MNADSFKNLDFLPKILLRMLNMSFIHSTPVENIRQISLFMQNKPNFPHFSPENEDYAKNKPNSNPIQTQSKPILGQYQGWQSQFKPNFLSSMSASLLWSLSSVGAYLFFCRGSGTKTNTIFPPFFTFSSCTFNFSLYSIINLQFPT